MTIPIDEIILKMKPGRFIQLVQRPGGYGLRSGTFEDFKKMGGNNRLFHLVGLTEDHNFNEFQELLEKTCFAANRSSFEYRITKWQDVYFVVVTIPIKSKQICLEMAKQTSIEVKYGIPRRAMEVFP